MTAYQDCHEMPFAEKLQGPTDLYRVLLTLKNGFGNGVSTLGCYSITKAQAKQAGIKWEVLISMVRILDLKISNRNGQWGHVISR